MTHAASHSAPALDDDLRQLYQEVILDHGRNPRNHRRPDHVSCEAHGNNPICGDRVTVYLDLDDAGTIRDVAFEGRGCAISLASASLMTELLKGRDRASAERLFRDFRALCTGEDEPGDEGEDPEALERLQVLAGVREFPTRVKCATLAWHTMEAALEGSDDVTTE
jgi:nitrogen fixation NifU-like protein